MADSLLSPRRASLPALGSIALLVLLTLPRSATGQEPSLPAPVLRGKHVWEPHEFVFRTGELGPGGAQLDESAAEPFNPWLNWRLNARFQGPSGAVFDVPGFYAGSPDGSGAGDVWKVRFAPDRPGSWSLVPTLEYASTPINVEPLGVPGERSIPLAPRIFLVQPADPSAPGFLGKGPLRHVGQNYLAFPDGTYWIKGGTNSPENFLGYAGFDGAQDVGGNPTGQLFLHEYQPHVADWQPGDPDWTANGDPHAGRGIIGALNYLASQGVNALYFLPNNLGGDCQDTFPFLQPLGGSYNRNWDASRMEQWNVVMEHATRKGILLHIVLAEQETPSVRWLGHGLTTERKLYFKNLIAMFGHNLGIKINFCEENGVEPANQFSPDELLAFADYMSMWDVYGHPLSVHNRADDLMLYEQILDDPGPAWLAATSLQLHDDYGAQVEQARALAELHGESLVIDQDEQGPVFDGLSSSNADARRKEVLYDVYFSGGNIEWYFGYASHPSGGDFDAEDFRTREPMWRYMRHARALLERGRFWRMRPDDGLVQGETQTGFGGAEVFAERTHRYLIYYPRATSTGILDLTHVPVGRTFQGNWFNPRTGVFEGDRHGVPTGALYAVPPPPGPASEDWVFVVQR